MKKILLALIFSIMFIGLVSAWSSDTFNNSLTSENLTFSVYCYQETANVSTTCGGVNTGVYGGADNSGIVFMNYTKPSNALSNSLWNVKIGLLGTVNYSIPLDCWNYNTNKLVLQLESDAVNSASYARCFNGTDWKVVVTNSTISFSGSSSNQPWTFTIDEDWTYWSISGKGAGIFHGVQWYRCVDDANLDTDGGCVFEEAMVWSMPITRYLKVPSTVSTLINGYLNLTGLPIYTNFLYDSYATGVGTTNVLVGSTGSAYYNFTVYINETSNLTADSFNLQVSNVASDSKVNVTICKIRSYTNTTCTDSPENLIVTLTTGDNIIPFTKKTFTANSLYGLKFYTQGAFVNDWNVITTYNTTNKLLVSRSNTAFQLLNYTANVSFNKYNYPTNITLTIGSTDSYNYTGIFNSMIKSANLWSIINNYLTPSYLVGSFYMIPFNFASATMGILEYSSLLFDNVGFGGITNTYQPNVTEGDIISINTTIIISPSVNSIILNYSGVLYTPTVTSIGTTYYINSMIIAPSVTTNTNKSFNYIIGIENQTMITPSYTQLILNANIQTNCSGSTFTILNITNYDEDSQIKMNGTVEYIFTLKNNGGDLTTISGNQSNINFTICSSINLSTSTTQYSLELRYYQTNYLYETYNIIDNPTTTMPINLNLYFLNQTNGVQFKINYVDFNYFKHSGAIVQMQRQYLTENVYKVVEIPKIGDSGQGVGSFSTSNIRYKLIIIDNGIVLDTFNNIYPSCQNVILGTCELNLRGTNNQTTTTTGDFTYTLDKTNSSIILTYIIPSGTPTSVTFVTNQNSRFLGNISNCNTTVFGSGGTITCGYNATVGDSIIDIQIISPSMNTLYGHIGIAEDLAGFYMLNNYVIGFVLLLSLSLMFVSSGVMLVIVSVIGFMFLGFIFLLRGMDLTTITSSLMWLIIASILIVYKIANKEEKT